MTIPLFSGEGGEIEVIYRYGNFLHRQGGAIQPTYLSSPQAIEEFKAANDLISLTFSGGLLLITLYFLPMTFACSPHHSGNCICTSVFL